jgi:aspartyl-tRNA(Asn)/glutamyl-tRNA(Gln) amidotransferase subunit B
LVKKTISGLKLPEVKNQRFQKKYQLTPFQAKLLTGTRAKADYFEETVKLGTKHGLKASTLANIIINKKVNIKKYLPAQLILILRQKQAQSVLSGKKLKLIIKQILLKNKKPVIDFKQGKTGALEYLVGLVMQASQGTADPNQTRKMLLERLKPKK